LGYKYRDGRERRFSVFFRWMLTWFTGFLTAMAGIFLLFCTQNISHLKRHVMEHFINTTTSTSSLPFSASDGIRDTNVHPLVYGILLGINVGLVLIAAVLTIFVEPVAAGSGISSPLIRPSHPLRVAGCRDSTNVDFNPPGVAAAFGAPIGGVLFVLEEGASFWNQNLTWRTLFCAMVSTFTLAFFISGMSASGWGTLGGQAGTFTLGPFTLSTYQVWEIPIFICMGAGGGIQGALFNAINLRLSRFRARWIQTKAVLLMEAIVMVVVVTTVAFWMSAAFGSCHPLPPVKLVDIVVDGVLMTDVTKEESYPYREEMLQFSCPVGQYNDLATLLLSPGESAIRHLFHAPPESFDMQILLVFWLATFCLACWTYGVKVPSGLFIPALLIGAAYGRLWTRLINHVTAHFPHAKLTDARIYGLIGSAAMLGGITRMTISLTVILLECTGNVEYGLPLIVTLFSARWVGNYFNHGIYDIHIHLRQLPFLDWDPPVEGSRMRVKHVMTRHPKCLRTVERAGLIWDYLSLTTHNGFPVVVDDPTFGSKFFAGVILRKQLTVLLAQKDFSVAKPRPFSRHPPQDTEKRGREELTCLSYRDMEASYPNYPEPDVAYTLTDAERDFWVDLTPYMNQTPFVIQEEAPFTRAYRLFRSSGLRHLVVVNRHMNVKGFITRRELEEDHCARCWRLTRGDGGGGVDDEHVPDAYNYSTKEDSKPMWATMPHLFKRHVDRHDQVRRMLHLSKALLGDDMHDSVDDDGGRNHVGRDQNRRRNELDQDDDDVLV
ncbi:hypothetical protein DYB32_006707, partial [Aphanomyces invadans]